MQLTCTTHLCKVRAQLPYNVQIAFQSKIPCLLLKQNVFVIYLLLITHCITCCLDLSNTIWRIPQIDCLLDVSGMVGHLKRHCTFPDLRCKITISFNGKCWRSLMRLYTGPAQKMLRKLLVVVGFPWEPNLFTVLSMILMQSNFLVVRNYWL